MASKQCVQEIPSAVSQALEFQPNNSKKTAWDVPLLQSASRPDRLEAALSELGEGSPLAEPSVEALRIARSKAKVLPLDCQPVRVRKSKERSESGGGSHLQSPEQKVVFEKDVQHSQRTTQAGSMTLHEGRGGSLKVKVAGGFRRGRGASEGHKPTLAKTKLVQNQVWPKRWRDSFQNRICIDVQFD